MYLKKLYLIYKKFCFVLFFCLVNLVFVVEKSFAAEDCSNANWGCPAGESCQATCESDPSAPGGCIATGTLCCSYQCVANACFLHGTKIAMADGTYKNVEKMEVKDKVKSYDKNGNVVDSELSKIFERERDFYFDLKAGEYEVKASAEHPFLTDKKNNTYTEIQYLKPGDTVFVREGDKYSEKKVTSNTRIDEKTPVYNMSVDNTHTYFANDFAVHNKGYSYPQCGAGTASACGVIDEPYSHHGGGGEMECGDNYFPSKFFADGTGTGNCQFNCLCCPTGQIRTFNPEGDLYSYTYTRTKIDLAPAVWDKPGPSENDRCLRDGQWVKDWKIGVVLENPSSCPAGQAGMLGSCIYTVTCRNINSTCHDPNMAPTLASFVLKSDTEEIVTAETGNKNHICQPVFNNSRTIQAVVNVADPDGVDDVTSVQLRWNGVEMTLDSFVYGVATFSHTFIMNQNNVNTNDFEVNITDSIGNTTGWISVGRSLKVWNCNVSVTSATFDGSAGQACNNTGFTTPLSVNNINFKNMSGGVDATTNLVWSDSYLPLVNGGSVASPDGDLQAAGRFTRLIDKGIGTTICPSSAQFDVSTDVSAYSTNPSVQVDLSYIRDQEGWFQGQGLDIRAKTEISSGVPVTADSALSIDNLAIGVSNNGMMAAANFRNTNGNNDGIYGIPHNWYFDDSGIDPHKYSYQTIYNDYFARIGVGITGVTVINTGDTGVMFVDGDLTISSNITVALGNYLMVVVSGAVNIDSTVTRVDGIYVANGNINAIGSSDNQLVINGVLYSTGDIRLARSFTTKSDNNSTPAVVVNYRPNLIFAMPGRINQILL